MDLSTAKWRKSSRSGDNGGHCIEVASTSSAVALRDSKNPNGGYILVNREDFRRFTAALKQL